MTKGMQSLSLETTTQMGQSRSLHPIPQSHLAVECSKPIQIKVLMQTLQDTESKIFPDSFKCSHYLLTHLE